jgi:Mg2+/Co2+ transporter CorB
MCVAYELAGKGDRLMRAERDGLSKVLDLKHVDVRCITVTRVRMGTEISMYLHLKGVSKLVHGS